MRIIFLPGGDAAPEIREIENDLQAIQACVEGHFEAVPIRIMISADIRMLVNEEGRLNGMQPNRTASYWYSGIQNKYLSAYDRRVIVGPAAIVSIKDGEFVDVSDYQLRFIATMSADVISWDPFEGRANE